VPREEGVEMSKEGKPEIEEEGAILKRRKAFASLCK